VEAARRGAEVTATDLSVTLVNLAQQRLATDGGQVRPGSIEFRVCDMLDAQLGQYDWVVAMDSLIHYPAPDMTDMIASLATRAKRGIVFTFAPRTPLLTVMHAVGKAFPRGNRAPAIEPIAEDSLRERLSKHASLGGFAVRRTDRIDSSFYISQAMEIVRP
jgi:magnesium-protoporphyrin O-methyltransferase